MGCVVAVVSYGLYGYVGRTGWEEKDRCGNERRMDSFLRPLGEKKHATYTSSHSTSHSHQVFERLHMFIKHSTVSTKHGT